MEIEALRQSFRPRNVKLLMIGESAPASGRFFYKTSNMTSTTARVFESVYDMKFSSMDAFLRFFMVKGCYLDDLSLIPVNKMPRREREKTLREGIPRLAGRIENVKPTVIVIALKKIEKHVREAIALTGLTVPVYVLPFPGQGHQRVFQMDYPRSCIVIYDS
ncbi:MAG: hypothetical protein KJ970_11060 [Candidatus Eisenbacteria bacterium]|uniref:Uracil-DNA glycosylase-like domain-containing protein n=1 Tax=Eiseniibacteriota bacterium TaxID=2212470 RepID=A0A948RV65_UNCEI|nr:hypothetical protein [Candidatus Eisenbacteria bacterium]MBU1950833.1 hypothetical protein [Candidatus Eisenbacteria bacterium]MBU2691455.1 hypothetical protein [Candidatus Eisenbacteria bacterium]